MYHLRSMQVCSMGFDQDITPEGRQTYCTLFIYLICKTAKNVIRSFNKIYFTRTCFEWHWLLPSNSLLAEFLKYWLHTSCYCNLRNSDPKIDFSQLASTFVFLHKSKHYVISSENQLLPPWGKLPPWLKYCCFLRQWCQYFQMRPMVCLCPQEHQLGTSVTILGFLRACKSYCVSSLVQ